MSEKPILFSGEMVRAILVGRKTQTRRLAKAPEFAEYKQGGLVWYDSMQNQEVARYPKYQPGDILWVREIFCPNYFDNYSPAYKADYDKDKIGDVVPEPKWKPSIHMPRSAARIFLRVKDVRAERVQDISEADAIAEGCNYGFHDDGVSKYIQTHTPEEQYAAIWDSLNAKRGYPWESNPFVWVYEFKRVENYA